MGAFATRVPAHLEAFDSHRVSPLQNFGVGESGVGHMGVDGACTVGIWCGTGATTNRFVLLVLVVTPDEVVHRSLGTCDHT